MSCHRGGKKRGYKKKGRQPCHKQYQDYCREQHLDGCCNDGNGKWMKTNSLGNENIKRGYQAQFGA